MGCKRKIVKSKSLVDYERLMSEFCSNSGVFLSENISGLSVDCRSQGNFLVLL